MIVNHIPLSWYVSRLRAGSPFSLTKHSDASLYCMQGKPGGDCNGCDYTPELRQGLLDSVRYSAPGFYHGVQRLTDRDNESFAYLLATNGIRDRVWIDTGILASQFVDGGLYPLVEALRELGERVVVVSNPWVAVNVARILPKSLGLSVPKSNAYNERGEIIDDISHSPNLPRCQGIYLLSCGMAACALIPQLHARHPDSSFIDVGHLWDALLGNKIRHYQSELTQDHIDRNLRPAK